MPDSIVIVANVACWGTIVVVWLAGALYNATHGSSERIRGESRPAALVAASVLVCAIVLIFGRGLAQDLVVGAAWVRALGLAVLVGSTLFALWARFALGTSWSVGPRVGGDGHLRTHGPYAVTRHPIYTGLLGMLLGTALLGGLGQWLVLVPAGLVVVELKIHMEEDLLLAIFPDEYPRYRQRVPQLIPGVRALRRRAG
jgi:protein-S-isoprenylcysteine O-methyltransferase Ste14